MLNYHKKTELVHIKVFRNIILFLIFEKFKFSLFKIRTISLFIIFFGVRMRSLIYNMLLTKECRCLRIVVVEPIVWIKFYFLPRQWRTCLPFAICADVTSKRRAFEYHARRVPHTFQLMIHINGIRIPTLLIKSSTASPHNTTLTKKFLTRV